MKQTVAAEKEDVARPAPPPPKVRLTRAEQKRSGGRRGGGDPVTCLNVGTIWDAGRRNGRNVGPETWGRRTEARGITTQMVSGPVLTDGRRPGSVRLPWRQNGVQREACLVRAGRRGGGGQRSGSNPSRRVLLFFLVGVGESIRRDSEASQSPSDPDFNAKIPETMEPQRPEPADPLGSTSASDPSPFPPPNSKNFGNSLTCLSC